MGDTEGNNIRELAEDMSAKIAVHEDGMVILVLGEGEEEEAFIIHPDLAENLGREMFHAGRKAKQNIADKNDR